MISLEQWRAAVGTFASFRICSECRGVISKHECVICLIVYACIIAMLLVKSGNVELNPGPFKKCPIL